MYRSYAFANQQFRLAYRNFLITTQLHTLSKKYLMEMSFWKSNKQNGIRWTRFYCPGTFLLTYQSTIKINYTSYSTKVNETLIEPHPPKTLDMKYLQHKEKLSLLYLHKIHVDNTIHFGGADSCTKEILFSYYNGSTYHNRYNTELLYH